jgi:hypothetical protein
MSLEQELTKAISTVPECLAGGYVDLSTGMLLGVRTVDSHPREILDLVAAATADLFQGSNVAMIETLWKRARGVPDDDHHYFQEIIINSDNLVHIFMRGKRYPDYVLMLVCRKSANLGMALTKSRLSLPGVEAAV